MEILEGLLFSILWASATVATKFAVHSVDPFLLTLLRFLVVALVLQAFAFLFRRKSSRLPTKQEFRQLFILGVLNVTVYMTGYLIAIKTVSAGLISLFSASNPLILILLSALVLKKKLSMQQRIGIAIAFSGLVLAAIPNLKDSHATFWGLIAFVAGITSLSFGSIYYSKTNIKLSKMSVNTWQISIGGLLFVPIVALNTGNNYLHADLNFYLSFAWLVVPVTIIAYALWLKLLDADPVKAGIWLFLTPVLSYIMAVLIMHEHITPYGVGGAILVVTGLLYSRRNPRLEMSLETKNVSR
jgi:probable blue pigment (indigoidine) exporter